MKVEWRLFAGIGGFLVLTSALYWFVSYEDAGTTMLVLGMAAVFMVAGWLFVQSRKVGLRPEDRPDARPEDGAGEVGYFPSSSIWPFVIGVGTTVVACGLAFGAYMALTGGLIMFVGFIGYAAEASSKG
jgi:hypothetical protein